tara:strand:- start:4235 stop:4615 length:381 start_codon:yes stop_codon:yes gene_type:complete
MPGLTTIYKWARENKEFAADLQDARKTGAATWLDRCLELLEQKDIPPNQLGFLREQMHHYRWLASKLISVYGDKSEVKQTGESTIKVMWESDIPSSSHETQALAHANGVQEKLDNPAEKKDAVFEA